MPNETKTEILPGCESCGAELFTEERERGVTCFACQKREKNLAAEPSAADFATLIGQCLVPDTSDEAQGALLTWMESGLGSFEITSFEDACLLTDDAGIVVRIGSMEFQITVVRTR